MLRRNAKLLIKEVEDVLVTSMKARVGHIASRKEFPEYVRTVKACHESGINDKAPSLESTTGGSERSERIGAGIAAILSGDGFDRKFGEQTGPSETILEVRWHKSAKGFLEWQFTQT